MTERKKKLIEVALPLAAINVASAREKSIRHGHPSTLHLWWARRPLAAARAVIFAQMVDDPSGYVDVLLSDPAKKRAAKHELKKRAAEREAKRELSGDAPTEPEPTLEEVAAELERKRLFGIIEDLVRWESTTNETVLERARGEIWQSWRRACAENADHPRAKELFDREKLPAFHDPFAGGGALPLEAQRLGLEAHASDLNPVAVLINKAMIEIPPRFAGQPPVNPKTRGERELLAREWRGATGLAEDVRFYGQWMRDEAEKRIGHLYPKVKVTPEMARERKDLESYVGRELTTIAWLWARTVKSPNPALAGTDVPLISTFMLSTKKGKEAYIEPVVDGTDYRFAVHLGTPTDVEAAKRGTRAGKAQDFLCLISGEPIPRSYVRDEGKAGRLGARLLAIVAEGDRERVYLTALEEHAVAAQAASTDRVVEDARSTFLSGLTPTRAMITGGVCSAYGLSTWGHLFSPRQLVALTTFSDLVHEARARVQLDAASSGLAEDERPLAQDGTGGAAYADALALYLAFGVDRLSDRSSTLCGWDSGFTKIRNTFARQALPMTWDFAEGNPFSGSTGNFVALLEWVEKFLAAAPAVTSGSASQADAAKQELAAAKIVSTDPPYYDNVGYAELSDFFYAWLRRSLQPYFRELFSTVTSPKDAELVAIPYRHGGQREAETFFVGGMSTAMHRLAVQAHPAFPVTVYYAFKQAEQRGSDGLASTGWETFLDAVLRAGFGISGTWPIRTELANRMIGRGTNALASSIVLVCRPRAKDAPTISRRELLATLKAELPAALAHLQRSNIAPVDLAQAAIGPGMAVYTRYARVLESDGTPLGVRTALSLINQVLDEALAEQEGDFDADTRWALAWFKQSGFDEGDYGVAETLSTAKNTSVSGLVDAGIIAAKGGKVRLLAPADLSDAWDPAADPRLTVWEMVHHLIRTLDAGGENAAAELAAKLAAKAETARELAYRLYTVCERKKRAAEALAYNALVQSWPEITRLAREGAGRQTEQATLFGGKED